MGEAFDRDGQRLGSATGTTKREVFDKLQEQFKDAAEIRIRTIEESISGAAVEIPRYRCHKEVRAAKITTMEYCEDGTARLMLGEVGGYMDVDAAFVEKHMPSRPDAEEVYIGGYLVVYGDGYQSFSPAKAFEDGYTRI
jgi:hypothetical protein